MSDRYICLHGHFYQPPRENPWLESIELQDSAHPYHDWNERISSECYAPNTASRILDDKGNIIEIVNNYSKINFNFGPTLLSWLQEKKPDIYSAILEADKASQKNYSGHGSAIAQAYNHMILPLANLHDKRTQVRWGIDDFKHRFNRMPEGMWLPETAVNIESLEVLAEYGILYTILSPSQAARSRKIGGSSWKDRPNGSVDPTMPYLVNLPSGKKISVFFFDQPISRGVAFETLLSNGDNFAHRLVNAFNSTRSWPQLVHIATDGETFGHHHRHGEMAVSYALHFIESKNLAKLTNYGEFLEKFPPTHEVEIHENTSWSCFHGIERWRSDCGCNTGSQEGWNQAWRKPLRDSLDWLRDTLSPQFENQGRQWLKDPWAARDAYIQVILDRSPERVTQFLEAQSSHPLNFSEKTRALKLLEMERQTLLMFTSCGWFFNDLTNIETLQVLQYAGRALQLAQELFGNHFEEEFLKRLDEAKSNVYGMGGGRKIFNSTVHPSVVTLEKVGAHYAMTSLFQTYDEQALVYCYTVDCHDYKLLSEGKAKLALGRAVITSTITGESKQVVFTALFLGDHNLTGATQEFKDEENFNTLIQSLTKSFESGDLPGFFRFIDKVFGPGAFSLKALFKDEQRKIINLVIESTIREAESVYSQLYEHHAPLMKFLTDLNMPLPRAFSTAAGFALNLYLREEFEQEDPDFGKITLLLEEARRSKILLDEEELSFTMEKSVGRLAERFQSNPDELPLLQLLELLVDLAATPPLRTNFWKTQNIFHDVLHSHLPAYRDRAEKNDAGAQRWVKHFNNLGEKLKVRN